MSSYTPQRRKLPYACLIELYLAGACPSGGNRGMKKAELRELVEAGGKTDTPTREASTIHKNGIAIQVTSLDLTMQGLNKKSKVNVVKHVGGNWCLLEEGEKIARNLCLRDGIPLPPFDQHHQPQQPQQAQQQPQQAQQAAAAAAAAAAHPGPASPAPRQASRAQQQQRGSSGAGRSQQTPPGRLGGSSSQRFASPAAAAAQAALRRQQQAQQMQQQEQQALRAQQAQQDRVQGAGGAAATGGGAGPSAQVAVGRSRGGPPRPSLAGLKRGAEDDNDHDVVSLLDDSDDDSSIYTRGGAGPSLPRSRRQRLSRWQHSHGDTQLESDEIPQGPQRQGQGSVQRAQRTGAEGGAGWTPPLVTPVQRLVEAGFDQEQAFQALLDNNGDLDAAAAALLAADGGSPVSSSERGPQLTPAAPQQAQQVEQQQQEQQVEQQQQQAEQQRPTGILGGGAFNPSTEWPLRRQQLVLPPLPAGRGFSEEYEVVLLLDSCERQRAHRGVERLVAALQARGLAVERRGLPVGDALWVARSRGGSGAEYVLDYVLERKSCRDLMSSIRDGRYTAQKYRMLRCGLTNRYYLLETGDLGQLKNEGEKKSVLTARTTTQVVDGFTLLISKHFDDDRLRPNTVDWLANLTRSIARRYSSQAGGAAAALSDRGSAGGCMTLPELGQRVRRAEEEAASGSMQWQLILMAIPGVSQSAAEAIAAQHPTPSTLLSSYQQALGRAVGPAEDRARSAASVVIGRLQCPRAGGPALSTEQALLLLQQLFPGAEQAGVGQRQRGQQYQGQGQAGPSGAAAGNNAQQQQQQRAQQAASTSGGEVILISDDDE